MNYILYVGESYSFTQMLLMNSFLIIHVCTCVYMCVLLTGFRLHSIQSNKYYYQNFTKRK